VSWEGGSAAAAERRHEQAYPISPEIEQQRCGSVRMEHHKEGQEPRRLLIDVPVQDGRQNNSVSETAHREKLSDTLEYRCEKRL
jgi:hypothetical protein